MPRPHRTDEPGAVHHVMIRGVDGRAIFSRVSDFEDFLARLAFLALDLGFLVLAWCLIANHAHFVLKTGRTPLAVLMARLDSRHAQRFNRFNARVGHLFQDRYKAVLIENESQLLATVPYVLGNAARHGLTTLAGLPDYPWSMYGALVGRRRPQEFENLQAVSEALGFERLGLPELVRQTALEPAALGARLEPAQIDELDRLIRDCCARHGIDRRALMSRHARVRPVRAEICSRALGSLDLTLTEIARHSGISYQTVRRLGARTSPALGQLGSDPD
jgi:REP element-mobilizing transposase RayT